MMQMKLLTQIFKRMRNICFGNYVGHWQFMKFSTFGMKSNLIEWMKKVYIYINQFYSSNKYLRLGTHLIVTYVKNEKHVKISVMRKTKHPL